MKTIADLLSITFKRAIERATGLDADPLVGVAQNPAFGDYQSNAAMGLAKQITQTSGQKTNPRAVAEKIMSALDLTEVGGGEVSVAGPGFINVRLDPKWLAERVNDVIVQPNRGIEPAEHRQTVVVDYSGPNVAKQMHVGHLRSTIIGDCIARVLDFLGHNVIRQNHIGDWGTQFGMLIALLRSQSNEGELHIADLDQFYKDARKRFDADPAFADEARATVVRLQAGGTEELQKWSAIVDESRRHFQPVYDQLHVLLNADDARGESFYNPMLPSNLNDLREAKVAVASEGATVAFTPGHETPLILEKTGGGFGYAATDLAAIRYRVGTLHADRMVYVVGAPQGQHFRQVFDVARRAGWAGNVLLEHAAFGSVLGEDGKMFKTRSGDTIKLIDLLDEAEQRAMAVVSAKNPELPETQKRDIARAVGIGAVKYADLSKDRIGDYVFSWDAMLSMDGNTAPYLQYAYARIESIFRKAGETDESATVLLDTPFELSLAKHALRFGEVLAAVSRELKPHLLCGYLFDLATRFSSFYENCPVLNSESATRASRLRLCRATADTLATGLELLGIEHPEQM